MKDGQLYYINFKGCIGSEINSIHLGVIFSIPHIKELIFCVPLTSPKEKHFKSQKDFEDRNYLNVKCFNWQYIKQTDSIALLDQIKTISIKRLKAKLYDEDNNPVILDEKNKQILILKVKQYINTILQ